MRMPRSLRIRNEGAAAVTAAGTLQNAAAAAGAGSLKMTPGVKIPWMSGSTDMVKKNRPR